jgi:hypothetical protein
MYFFIICEKKSDEECLFYPTSQLHNILVDGLMLIVNKRPVTLTSSVTNTVIYSVLMTMS